LNAAHVLQEMLREVMPGPDGKLREELRAGLTAVEAAEADGWAELPPGDEVLAEVGGQPLDAKAAPDYYRRNWTDTSLDVNQLQVGAPRTIVPAFARATVTLRLAPHQDPAEIAAAIRALLLGALPAGAEAELDFVLAGPVLFGPEEPAIQLAAAATRRATGVEPRLVRWGGTIPIVAELARKQIPVVVGGFALPDDAPHAPNESYRLESLRLGELTARELYQAFATLPQLQEDAT
jgi:acetylornithine deacetylase/succinyl-diaminopimelate desuccinylase-like protein